MSSTPKHAPPPVFKKEVLYVAGFAAFAILVWPTMYVNTNDHGTVVRVNRFTGVEQESTSDGWMTTEQIKDKKENVNRKKSDAAIEDLRAVVKDGDDEDVSMLAVNNPTKWRLFNDYSRNDMKVEYFAVKDDGNKTFLFTEKLSCNEIASASHTEFKVVRDYSSYSRMLDALPKGASFEQKISLTFSKVEDTQINSTTDSQLPLYKPFTLDIYRQWTKTAN